MSEQKKRKQAKRDPRKEALTKTRFWLNRCYDLGITAEEAVAHSVSTHNVITHKENEGEKRTSPLNPSLEKRAKQEKAAFHYGCADAHGKVDLKAIEKMVGPVDEVPTLDLFLAWCEAAGFKDEAKCKQRYNDLVLCGWRDEKAKAVKNWPRYFLKAMRRNPYKGEYQKLPDDIKAMFDGFWSDYPDRRRRDKDKCASKFRKILLKGGDPVRQFNTIMEGLAKWKASSDWTKEGGEYVMMPFRWLHNQLWAEQPGVGYHRPRRGVSQTANVFSKEVGTW